MASEDDYSFSEAARDMVSPDTYLMRLMGMYAHRSPAIDKFIMSSWV